jgi:hypothetical protein
MKPLTFDLYVWQMNDGLWRLDQRTNARLHGAVRAPWNTGAWDKESDARQHLRLIEEELNARLKPLLETLEFITGHARLAATNYGSDKESSIQNRNKSFDEIERRCTRVIAEARGAP